MQLELVTRTPLWTGDINGKSDTLQTTGIIGSLRWWYEAIVRGMGGWVSDPTLDNPDERSKFDTSAFEKAKREGKDSVTAIQEGLKTLCPVSYLFGATGWSRLFQLHVLNAPTEPLHFRTTLLMNKNWLKEIFNPETKNIDSLKVIYGKINLTPLSYRGVDVNYAQSQITLLFNFISEYASLGAKPQHGFGVVKLEATPEYMTSFNLESGLVELRNKLNKANFRQHSATLTTNYDLRNFLNLKYTLPKEKLRNFLDNKAHLGNPSKKGEIKYLPCAFDLRYKGAGNWGIRNWLEEQKNWAEEDINTLMGLSVKRGESIKEDTRTASLLNFSMPYEVSEGLYEVRIFGFAPPKLLTPEELRDLCRNYFQFAFSDNSLEPVTKLGKDLLLTNEEIKS